MPQNQFFWHCSIQERFWQKQCTWWKDNSTFGGQFSKDRKWGRCSQRSRSFIVRHNSWEYSEFTGTPWGFPQKIFNHLSQENDFREYQFLGFSMMTLISSLTKFIPCRSKLIKIKQNEKHFIKILVKGLKMTLARWIWAIWTMLTTVAFVGHLLHFLCPETCHKNWFCCKVFLDDFYRLLHIKSSSWIHIGVKRISKACCLYHLKNIGKKCKRQLWDEKQNLALFCTTLYIHCWKQ